MAVIQSPEIREALKQGDEKMQDLLKGPATSPYQREEQIDRANQALNFLKSELSDLSKEEKKRVIEASRVILRAKLDEVVAERRTNADERMKQLEDKINTTIKAADDQHTDLNKADAPAAIPAPAVVDVKEGYLPKTVDPREWSNKQIATMATITLGTVGLYALWRRWSKGSNEQTDAAPKSGLSRFIWWIPGIGIAAVMIYGGYQILKRFDSYEKAIAALKNKIPGMPDLKKETYGLEKEDFKKAEEEYRKNRGTPDTAIRALFNLKASETNPEFERFMKDMSEKYKERKEDGITYARADVMIRNYETQMEVALQSLGKWIADHDAEIGAIALVGYRTGLFTIKGILNGAESVAVKSAKIAKEMARMGISHPLLSLFAVGGTFLGLQAALYASKKAYLPENFRELGIAFAMDKAIVIGDIAEAVKRQLGEVKGEAIQLANIGADFSAWVGTAVIDFGQKALEKGPDAIGLDQTEVIVTRNIASMDKLNSWLETKKKEAMVASADVRAGKVQKLEEAIAALDSFAKALKENRLDTVTDSTAPETELQKLRTLLTPLGVQLSLKEGKVRWKADGMSEADLCVDPALKDKAKIYEASEKLREEGQSGSSYIFWRAIQKFREEQHQATARADIETGFNLGTGKVLAMVMGNVFYCTSPENQWEFWSAPVHLVKDLFEDKTTTERVSNAANAGVTATLVSMSAATVSRFKRLAIGGGSLVSRDWRTIVASVNPVTSPLRLLREVSRGVIDFETFARLGAWSENGGRYFNSLLGKAGIRPEWIGNIETATNMEELVKVGSEMDVGHLPNDVEKARTALRNHVIKKLEKVEDVFDVALKKWVKVGNYKQMYDAAAEWYKGRSKVAKVAEYIAGKLDTGVKALTTPWELRLKSAGGPTPLALQTEKLLKDARFQKLLAAGAKATAQDIEAFIQLATEEGKLNAAAVKAIRGSPGAQKLLVGAAATGDFDEIQKMLNAANKAGPWRSTLNAAGAVGDVFGVYMAYMDYEENGRKIRATNNKDLQELYKEAQTVNVVQGGVSAVGFVIGTTAVITSQVAAGSTVAVVSTSAGLVMLPITLAVGGGVWMRGKLEKESEELLMTESDWGKLSEGELMEAFVNNRLGAANAARSFDFALREIANLGADSDKWKQDYQTLSEGSLANKRSLIFLAYLCKSLRLPKQPGETDIAHKDRVRLYLMDASIYISKVTKKTFDITQMNPQEVLSSARMHAQLCMEARQNPDAVVTVGTSEQVTLKEYRKAFITPGKEGLAERVLQTRKDERMNGTLAQLVVQKALNKEKPEAKDLQLESLRAALMGQMSDSIYHLEGKIRATSFDMVWTSDETRNIIRYTAAMLLKEAVEREAVRLNELPELSLAEFERSLKKVHDEVFMKDLGAVMDEGMDNRKYSSSKTELKDILSKGSALLTPQWLGREILTEKTKENLKGTEVNDPFVVDPLNPPASLPKRDGQTYVQLPPSFRYYAWKAVRADGTESEEVRFDEQGRCSVSETFVAMHFLPLMGEPRLREDKDKIFNEFTIKLEKKQ